MINIAKLEKEDMIVCVKDYDNFKKDQIFKVTQVGSVSMMNCRYADLSCKNADWINEGESWNTSIDESNDCFRYFDKI